MGLASAIAGDGAPIVMRFRYEHRTANNVFLEVIDAGIVGGSIDLDNDRAITRGCTVTLDQELLPPSFELLTSYLAIFAEVLVDGLWERLQLGLFRLTTPVENQEPSPNDTVSIRGSDVTYVLNKGKTDVTYEVPSGTNYVFAVETILTNLGLTHGLSPASGLTPLAFTWAPGTAWSVIVNELLLGINNFEAWADAAGIIRSRIRTPPADVSDVVYTTDVEPRMIVPPFRPRDTEATIPNIVVGLTQDPNRSAIFASATNVDPESPFSVTATDVRYAEITNDRVLDGGTLQDYAVYELLLATGVGQSADLRTLADPRRANNESYDVTIEGLTTRWRVRGWRLPLDVGIEMTHRLQRADNIEVGTAP